MYIVLLLIIILILLGVLIFCIYKKNNTESCYLKSNRLILCRDKNRIYFAEDIESNKLRKVKITYFKLEEKQNLFYSKLRSNDKFLNYEADTNDCYLVSDIRLATIFKIILDENQLDLFYDESFVKIKSYLDDSLITCKNIALCRK